MQAVINPVDLEKPTTEEEWKRFIGQSVQVRTNAGPHPWVMGCKLIDVYDGKALVERPKGGSEHVALAHVKLSLKGIHETNERQGRTPEAPRATAEPEMPDDDKIVVYLPGTGGFLGGTNGKRTAYAGLREASRHKDRTQAYDAKGAFKQYHGVDTHRGLYLTVSEARTMLAEGKIKEEPIPQSAPRPVKDTEPEQLTIPGAPMPVAAPTAAPRATKSLSELLAHADAVAKASEALRAAQKAEEDARTMVAEAQAMAETEGKKRQAAELELQRLFAS